MLTVGPRWGDLPGAPTEAPSNTLAYLDMPVLSQPEVFIHVKQGFFGQNGDIASPDTRQFLQRWMDAYVAWVKKLLPSPT